jgi:hypothetical protein
MPRCPDCAKWVSVEQPEPEVDIDIQGDDISGTVRIVLECANCGTELKQTEFDVAVDISEHLKHKCPDAEIGVGWNAEMEDIEATMRQHPPKAQRRTTYYGASGNIRLKCQCDEVDVEIPWSDEIKASQMEELT